MTISQELMLAILAMDSYNRITVTPNYGANYGDSAFN